MRRRFSPWSSCSSIRLNVYPLAVPPLRERRGDIALIAGYFCDLARRRLGLGPVRPAADALDALAFCTR